MALGYFDIDGVNYTEIEKKRSILASQIANKGFTEEEAIQIIMSIPDLEESDVSNSLFDAFANFKLGKGTIDQRLTISINGTNYDFRVIGLNHDDKSDGSGKAKATLQMVNYYNTTYSMNSSNTNSGSRNGCKMRTETMVDLLSKFPSFVQKCIVEVNKETAKVYNSSTIQISKDKLFLLSRNEIGGSDFTSTDHDEGEQYEYWKNHDNNDYRRCGPQSNPTSYNWYWCRDPDSRSSSYFGSVYSSGNSGYSYASYSGGVRLAFCI